MYPIGILNNDIEWDENDSSEVELRREQDEEEFICDGAFEWNKREKAKERVCRAMCETSLFGARLIEA